LNWRNTTQFHSFPHSRTPQSLLVCQDPHLPLCHRVVSIRLVKKTQSARIAFQVEFSFAKHIRRRVELRVTLSARFAGGCCEHLYCFCTASRERRDAVALTETARNLRSFPPLLRSSIVVVAVVRLRLPLLPPLFLVLVLISLFPQFLS